VERAGIFRRDDEIVVADGGSRDGTREAAERRGARVVLQRERGYGGALLAGFAATAAPYIVTMDADLSHRPVFLVDIASGPALYILSVLEEAGEQNITAYCRDLDERWLRDGAAEARRRGLTNVHFERGDAFDRTALVSLRPQPNLAVSSGFYDWITDDADVERSLAILYEVLEPGGWLVLTNQMAHPNLEFVSRVFVDFNQQPLRMTMRSTQQVRDLLTRTGFVVERALADSWGYYSVMKARKP